MVVVVGQIDPPHRTPPFFVMSIVDYISSLHAMTKIHTENFLCLINLLLLLLLFSKHCSKFFWQDLAPLYVHIYILQFLHDTSMYNTHYIH